MPTIRPITLHCDDTAPKVSVRQQAHPLHADDPECWITTVELGSYPNQIHLTFETDTPGEGVELVNVLVRRLVNATAAKAVTA